MNLAIFDVDGTLTRTLEVDSDCFVTALADEFRITGINCDWGKYLNYTDSGITCEIFRQKLGREPSPAETTRLTERFLTLLGNAWGRAPERFSPVAGAGQAVDCLRSDPDWKISIATGCWLKSARFKLVKAGINTSGIPIASSDDSMIREEIVKLGIKKASSHYRTTRFERIVYVGDGVWDARTARRLGLPFLGVGPEEKIRSLRQVGARHFLKDFTDYSALLSKLREATIPEEATE